MSFDAERYRDDSARAWEAAAPGWVRHHARIGAWAAPVAHWLVEAISPQPGQTVLELAAGLGETGMLAAELVAPAGRVIVSDQSAGMLDGARRRAEALGLDNVEFEVLGAEWIDLPLASVDAVLCRWGYMLMADPGAALSETRRVLRPSGRVALAVWDALEHNPWARLPTLALSENGIAGGPGSGDRPGPFTLGDRALLRSLIEDAGFTEPHIEDIALMRRHESFDELWEFQLDVSQAFHEAVMSLTEPEIAAVRATLRELLGPHTAAAGTIELPGRTLVAVAEA
ncbi:MAG TPA: methyltransferase domain-containing protein [Solirubrobacteraceae bacterium]|nr:methyltransferase domain-containing protein [Solirubrobacteraceae bacterium]